MLCSINQQLFEAFQALNAQLAEQSRTIQALTAQTAEQSRTIQALTAQAAEQSQTIQSLESEILGYVLSRSWQMTRPLRMISRALKRAVRK